MNRLRKVIRITGICIGVIVVAVFCLLGYSSLRWDAAVARPVPPLTASHDAAAIARGEFLFKKSLNCWGCHSPDNQGNAPPSGGVKFDLTDLSPALGVYYARNITPDSGTGIGSWTDGEIVRAIREGIRKDGRVLFPIMPVDPLYGLSDTDVLALVSYMRTIPPVKNAVPERMPSLFAKTLMTVGMIGPMKQVTEPIVAPQRALTREYGEYVTRHAALCAECHTPRNLMDGDFYYDSLLAGSSISFGDKTDPVISYAPNITPDPATGIGQWTEDQFLLMMRSGLGPDGKVRTRHMPYAYFGLWDSLELRAVYAFIRSIPPVRRTVVPSKFINDVLDDDPFVKGRGVYNSYCIPCHGAEGKGAPPTNVVLAEVAPSLSDADLAEFVRSGDPSLRMPSFRMTLSDKELSCLVAYVKSWKEKSK